MPDWFGRTSLFWNRPWSDLMQTFLQTHADDGYMQACRWAQPGRYISRARQNWLPFSPEDKQPTALVHFFLLKLLYDQYDGNQSYTSVAPGMHV